jgi:hypothetical protein
MHKSYIYEVADDLVVDEQPVAQVDDFRDTDPMGVPSFRAQTSSDWPPAPPLPADVDLAMGTVTEGVPAQRNAGFYAVVRRPTTSSDTND